MAQSSKHAADALASERRFDVEVKEIAADCAGVLECWWEIHQHEAGTGYDAVVLCGEPAEVFVALEFSRDPRPEVRDYGVQEVVVGPAHVDEHAVTVVGEKVDVVEGDRSRGDHASF